MTLEADRLRRARAYRWFDRGVLAELGKQVAALPPDAEYHLRTFDGQNERGQPTLWFQLWSGTTPNGDSAPCGDPVNASHVCPPDC